MDILQDSPQSKLTPQSCYGRAIRRISPHFLSIALSGLLLSFGAQAQSHIRIAGGTPIDRKYLSAGLDGNYVDLFSSDDGSGRQRWVIEAPAHSFFILGGKPKWVHIRVAGGTPPKRTLLSVSSDGEIADLFGKDDDSGRQKWIIEPQPGGYVHIRILDGTPADRKFLSVDPSGASIDLTDSDDGSGRQRWIIDPPMPATAVSQSSPPPAPPAQKK